MAQPSVVHLVPTNDRDDAIARDLNTFLANTYVLTAKTQAFHWNATGPNFIGLHKLTESQYGELFEATDQIAERVRALRVKAPAGLAGMLLLATLEEADSEVSTDKATRILVDDNITLSRYARQLAKDADDAGDYATHDMMVRRIEIHDKAAWLYRSNLE